MAAYDNVQLPGSPTPASYAPPLVDMSALGSLGDAYYKGQEQQQKQKIRQAFADGVPADQKGAPDYSAMAQKLFRLGDFGDASNVLKTGYAIKMFDQGDTAQPSPFGGGASAPPASAAPSAAPAAQPVTPQRVGPLMKPEETSNYGGDNTTVGPAQDIPPGMSTTDAIRNVQQTGQVQPTQVAQNAPQPGLQANPQAAPQGGTSIADSYVPEPWRGKVTAPAYRDYLRTLADQKVALAQRMEQQGAAMGMRRDTQPLLAQAAQYRAVADKIDEALAPTTEQKNLTSGTTRANAITDSDVKLGQAEYAGIGAAARQYVTATKPYVQLSKSILNQPETYTGIGANGVATLNKLKATFGDTKGAQYYEALQKVTAASVLGALNTQKFEAQEAGSNTGRIFSQQVDLVAKSTLSTDNSLAGNRFLIGVQERLGDFSERLAKMAATYKRAHGTLDAGFDDAVSADLEKHPLFTPLEQQHPNLIGAPTSPFNDVKRTQVWAKKMGLEKGDPIRAPNGKIVAVP